MSTSPIDIKPSGGLKVSVCVITYNHDAFIRQCLQSLVSQRTSFRFEIVVGEDGSTDGTRGIVEEFADSYPGLLRPLLRERNIGAMANFLDVHRAARGEYVCHCDGDDLWEPDKLEQQVRFLDAHRECSAVFTNSHVISEHGERIGVFSSGVAEIFDIGYLIRDGNFLHHSSMMYRRMLQNSIYPAAAEFIDFHVYVLLARLGRLGYIKQCLTSYRAQSSVSVIRNDNSRIRRCGWNALYEVTPADASRRSIRRADATFLADAAYQALRSGRPGRYLEWLALARQRDGASLMSTQWTAFGILVGSTLRRLTFHARVRLGLVSAKSRVFYPK